MPHVTAVPLVCGAQKLEKGRKRKPSKQKASGTSPLGWERSLRSLSPTVNPTLLDLLRN